MFQHKNNRLHYELTANGIPEDTLFIHGNLASNRWWYATREVLLGRYSLQHESGGLCLAEWPGCGRSAPPTVAADLEMKSLASDFVALVRGLGMSGVNIVGHSTGGLIGLCALLEAPELFNRAVLLDPVAANGIQFGPEMYDAFTKMSKDRAFCESVMLGTIHNVDAKDPLVQSLVDDAYQVNRLIWHGIPDSLKNIDIRSELKKIHHPLLVLHGEFDTLLPIAGSMEIAETVKNGTFMKVEGHGHSLNVENPEKFCNLISEFLFES